MRYILALFIIFLFGACSFNAPKPWEKGNLAQDKMQLEDSDGLKSKVYSHVFSAKEGSFGGEGIGGGGCGCN